MNEIGITKINRQGVELAVRGVRIERRVADGEFVSVEVDRDADKYEVMSALRALDHIAPLIADACPGCHTPYGTVHTLDCPEAPDGYLYRLRSEAGLA